MKTLPDYHKIPGLEKWVIDVQNTLDPIKLQSNLLLDNRVIGGGVVTSCDPVSVKGLVEKIKRLDLLLPESVELSIVCSDKAKAKLKHRKIPSRFTIPLIWRK
ncbi:hypothetical protein CENTIMANUS_00298 [Klebsiella phage vB_KpM_Centimanus]